MKYEIDYVNNVWFLKRIHFDLHASKITRREYLMLFSVNREDYKPHYENVIANIEIIKI